MSRGLPTFPKKKRGKYFVIRVTSSDGSRPWIKLGESREQAYINYLDYLKQIKSQRSDYSTYRATINQGIDAFMENTKSRFGKESKTYVRYRNYMDNLRRFLSLRCRDLIYMDEIKERHILDYRDFRRTEKNRSGKNISPTTVNNELDFISTTYTYLIEERNLTLTNPIKKIKRLDEPDPDDFYYKPDEVRKILETSKQFSTRNNWHAVFTVFFYTGMRRNELRFLTWEDINFQDKVINIRPKQISKDEKFRVKNRRPRIIPLLPQVEVVLKSLSKKSDRWVFTNSRSNTFSNDTIRQEFRKICEAAGLPLKKLHLTRHSWTSIAYEKGVPEPAIQAAGGWSDPKTMRRYNHSGANREYVNKAFQENFSIGEEK
jgi:integrase/recombinase XerD